MIEGIRRPFVILVDGPNLQCDFRDIDKADVEIQIREEILNSIIAGHMTFQRAFMGGDMTMKGDFRILRTLDQIFTFMNRE